METKQHKFHPRPSIAGLLMGILQTLNSLTREKSFLAKCYACDRERSQEEFRAVNHQFVSLPPSKFAFMIDNLGLSGLSLPSEFFTDESINVCWKCFRAIEQ